MTTTAQQLLWESWGSSEHPAEWDGRDGNGGKGSQRFWEYLWALNQISYECFRLFVDVGAGHGCFFAELLSAFGCTVWRVDPLLPKNKIHHFPVTLREFVSDPQVIVAPSFVTCISVLEHVADKPEFCRDLDQFQAPIVLTFECGPGGVEHKEVYRCLDQFKAHHAVRMERCPLWADNSDHDKWRPMGVVLECNR